MELTTIGLYDDTAVNLKLMEPVSDSQFVENNPDLAPLARTTITLSDVPLKGGVTRRMIKVDVPVLETVATAGNSAGYIAAPQVAHTISATVAVFSNTGRATPTQIAHAVKLLVNFLLADSTAGTASTYVGATTAGRKFLIAGIGGD